MSADVFVHGDELIWKCHWLILASECPADRWFPKKTSDSSRVFALNVFNVLILIFVHINVK